MQSVSIRLVLRSRHLEFFYLVITNFRHAKPCVMALSSERHDSAVNPDRGIYVEMESVMEVRYTSDDPDYWYGAPPSTTTSGIGLPAFIPLSKRHLRPCRS